MTMRAAVAALLFVAGCSERDERQAVAGPPDLETAAIERGLVVDSETVALAGLYARGEDRVCITGSPGRYRIGAFVEIGDDLRCSASGTVVQHSERLVVQLGSGCAFEGRYDGVRIAFPGILPQACARVCPTRASFEGLLVERLSESQSEAAALRDFDGRLLCNGAA